MTLQQLHVFLNVVTQGSIHGAARALGVTQPAITASMRELEKTLGVPLLLRSVKGVKLTSYGAVFYRRAKSITADMKRAEDELLEMRGEQAGSVVVGLSELAECSMLQKVFSEFRREGRGALLSFYQTSFSSALGRLFENAMDFAIVTGQRATKFPDFVEARRLFSMPVVLVARPSHPKIHERRIDALTDEEWLLPCEVGDDTDRAFTQYFEFIGLQTPRVSRCLTVSAATLLLQEADLIAPVQYPTFKLKMEGHGLVTIPVEVEGVSMSAYLLTRRDHRLSDDAEALLAMFEEVAEEVPFVERDALTA